ncbi:RNA methyltransferase [Fulvimarina endophytica]|uniref:RNA methyltransferase n=1 Tax=Fulvimarina endophytica TaxID=2293836 RepID=A0A371WY89_9HYPH|nr:RNA methyltransferase [Fulvimarina endophytica]RFC61938.1 RNA methyltransferase [Fulvimarina endophytica]
MTTTDAIAGRPAPIPITDPDDPRIAVFRAVREKDLTGRHGFIAEGSVVLDQLALSRRFRPSALLVLDSRLAGITDRIARLPQDCPVYVASREVIDAIAGFPMHRGVLAHGIDMAAGLTAADVLSVARAGDPAAPILIALGIANHDNMGALFRNARAFGAGAVLMDEASCHPLYRKAVRVSVGTVLTEPWARGGTPIDLIEAAIAAGYEPLALDPKAEGSLGSLDPSRPRALVLGAEGPGLPRAVTDRIAGVRIAMRSDVDSLNVATSAAIVLARLYEARADLSRSVR